MKIVKIALQFPSSVACYHVGFSGLICLSFEINICLKIIAKKNQKQSLFFSEKDEKDLHVENDMFSRNVLFSNLFQWYFIKIKS